MSKESTYPQDNKPGDTRRQSFKGLGTFQDPILFYVDDDATIDCSLSFPSRPQWRIDPRQVESPWARTTNRSSS